METPNSINNLLKQLASHDTLTNVCKELQAITKGTPFVINGWADVVSVIKNIVDKHRTLSDSAGQLQRILDQVVEQCKKSTPNIDSVAKVVGAIAALQNRERNYKHALQIIADGTEHAKELASVTLGINLESSPSVTVLREENLKLKLEIERLKKQ